MRESAEAYRGTLAFLRLVKQVKRKRTRKQQKCPWAVKTPTKARKGLLLKGKVTKPRTSDVLGLLWGQQWPLNAPTGNLAAVTLKPFARQHGEYLRFLPTGVCCITV